MTPSTVGASPSNTASPASVGSQSLASENSEVHLNVEHLELLYNFVTFTSSTFSNNETIKILWQTSVVTAGFSCHYVMLSILAFSALHLSRLKPDKHHFYLSQATSLHQAALSKGSPAIGNITAERAENLCLFAALTFYFALGRPRAPGDFLMEGESGLTEWLVMFRGMRSIVESTDTSALYTGPLGPMFAAGRQRAELQLSAPMQVDHLWTLQRLINDAMSSREEFHVYNLAIDQLREAFNLIYNQNTLLTETADVFCWLYRLSDEYLLFINQRRPEALVIFAYFCVLLKRLDAMWWIQGSGSHLVAQIYSTLDETHRLWIIWPMREIGWTP